MKRFVPAALLLILGGCGARGELKLPQVEAAPATAYGAKSAPGPGDLLKAPPQTRPARSDDLIESSDKRRTDEYDLPPSH
jgi:predicted small lipoprotein YifL